MAGDDNITELIAEYTAGLFAKYERLKAGDKSIPFWDLVALCCSSDERTEAAFKRCVSALDLPPSAEYRVLPDPPGPKIEGGGATLHALEKLRAEYGNRLDELRVLLIQAGGFSKRLVHHAVLGKLFSVLPWGERGLTVLELKLAMYLPYAALLPGAGMFNTSCDDLQLAWLPAETPEDLFAGKPEGFVTPSHPAPVSTAVNHGVYVLPPSEKNGNQYLYTSPCEEILQKPSQQLMRERGAVFMQGGRETVQIDGAFWASPATVRTLESLYSRLRPLTEELSGWRDFLPPCGRLRPGYYESAEVPRLPPDSARRRTFEALVGTPLTVLAVPRSRFYHLGTVPEYLHHLCSGGGGADGRGGDGGGGSDGGGGGDIGVGGSGGELAAVLRLRRRCHALGPPQEGVLLSSVLSPQIRLPSDAMAEFCRLEGAIEVGAGTLLSHCHVVGPILVPPHVLLHTAAVTWQGQLRHVAIAMGVRDGVKEAPARLLGRPVEGATGSLWSARLFEAADSMAEAAAATLRRLAEGPVRTAEHLWSMDDVMKNWDPMTMLDFRDGIYTEVEAAAGGDRL